MFTVKKPIRTSMVMSSDAFEDPLVGIKVKKIQKKFPKKIHILKTQDELKTR